MAKIAIIFDCLYPVKRGGAEKVYRVLADRLAASENEVTYITREHWDEPESPKSSFRIVTPWAGEIYNSHGDRTIQGALGFSAAVHRYLRTEIGNYDAVIVSSTPAFLIPIVSLLAKKQGVKVIADWLEVWSLHKWARYAGAFVGLGGFLFQLLALNFSKNILVNSEFTKAKVRRYNLVAPIITLGLFDLDPRPKTPVQSSRESSQPPYALFVGRIIEDKKLDTLAPMLARLNQMGIRLQLKVVGIGPQQEKAAEAFLNAGVADQVDFLGKVGDEELSDLYANAAVHLFPTVREGFGLVVVEAASHGVPTVLVEGEDNAAVELIQNGVNGFVSPSHDPGDLSQAVYSVLNSQSNIRDLAREWFDTGCSNNNLDRSVQEINDLIRR